MKDLTQGSVAKHLLGMAAFMAVSMLVQTLYLLADLYWVGSLGKEAIAAVGVAGSLMMIVLALTQMLGVGTTTLISHAAGQKDQKRAELVFNQSFVMSILVALALGVVGFGLRDVYCNSFSADAETAALAKSYLNWFLPALLLQFPLVALGSALRANGLIKPTVAFQLLSVVLNIVLAPVLIFGWIGFPKLGVTGAALASFVAILVADIGMMIYFEKKYHYLRFRLSLMRPQIDTWGKMLRIGVPAGAEFILLFFYILIVYGIIRNFGPAAQAGFGVGARDAGAVSAGGCAQLRRKSGRRPKLRRAPRRSRPANCLFRARDRGRDDVCSRPHYLLGAGRIDPAILQRSTGHCFRQRISQDRRTQLRGGGNCFHELKYFPGNRQYLAATFQFDDALGPLRPSRCSAYSHSRIPAKACLVFVGHVAVDSGVHQSLAPAPRAAQETKL